MTKKELTDFGKLIMRVNLSAYQRYQLIESLPYLSAKKLKTIYHQLKTIHKSEQSVLVSVTEMKSDFESGRLKIGQ